MWGLNKSAKNITMSRQRSCWGGRCRKRKADRYNHDATDIFPEEAYLHPRDRVSPACLQLNRGPGDRVTVSSTDEVISGSPPRAVHTHPHPLSIYLSFSLALSLSLTHTHTHTHTHILSLSLSFALSLALSLSLSLSLTHTHTGRQTVRRPVRSEVGCQSLIKKQ